jgi:hypothetical protein
MKLRMQFWPPPLEWWSVECHAVHWSRFPLTLGYDGSAGCWDEEPTPEDVLYDGAIPDWHCWPCTPEVPDDMKCQP